MQNGPYKYSEQPLNVDFYEFMHKYFLIMLRCLSLLHSSQYRIKVVRTHFNFPKNNLIKKPWDINDILNHI